MRAEEPEKQNTIPQWVSWLIYALLAILMTWPLAQHLYSHLNSTDTDVSNVFWGNWWVRTALAAGQNPYSTRYLIYPVGFNLVTFAFSLFLALLALPLSWILPAVAAYNVLAWVTIVLCCIAMDQLVRYLTDNGWPALARRLSDSHQNASAVDEER
jgi:hypothetical protein